MRTTYIIALCLLAATSNAALAQETTAEAETMAEDIMEEGTMDADMTDDPMDADMTEDSMDTDMADDAADTDMADDATDADIAEDAMEEVVPNLEEIAAADPALDGRTNEDGEVDAMVMLSDVLFNFGDASLAPSALEVLAGVAAKLDGVPSIEITGHTDAIGDEGYNIALGQRRADAVRDWLVANTALTADVVTARGVGEADPIAGNRTADGADNPEGRALNRRVEFTLPDAG